MKLYFSLLFCLFTLAAWAQPVNDDCSGIIDLGLLPICSDPGEYTNVGATASNIDPAFNIPDCFNSGGVQRDVWFQFTVPADGSILDVTVTVTGNQDGNGTLQNPQVAVYRGDCAFGELNEIDCASAPNGENAISLDLFGLTAGFTYFVRVNDYSATATPNAGTFKICATEYVAEIIMGETPSTQSCTGTLYDSGGALGDYTSGESLTFTICPQDFHQCIIINVEEYAMENNFDFLSFFQGEDLTGVQLGEISGQGNNLEVQVTGDCATIAFNSDGSAVDAGFKLTWECSTSPCTAPPLVTCDAPVVIPSLPYSGEDFSNCFSGNSIAFDPCGSGFLDGNDYVFTYNSQGDECITVSTVTGSASGVGIYSACPNDPDAACIAVAGGNFGDINPVIQAAFLENPGTYYIVFGTTGSCTTFDLNVDTVTCPVLLPPASTCDVALNIGGCSTDLPEIIALNPGAGDPNFLVDGVNQGCFVNPQENFSFFYFKAGSDGKFGFTVQAADPLEASDIDFNVWGPIDNYEDICDYTSSNQPVRSSWTGGALPTGMQDIHPETGIDVLDDFDCGDPSTPGAGGDRFVRQLDVIEGKYYVILLDDFGQAIESGGIAIDFSGTTSTVLTPEDTPILAGPDTTLCNGQTVTLFASGGEAYFWDNDGTLSCSNCENPVASPLQSSIYQVQIAATCGVVTKSVQVDVYFVELGPDATVCAGAEFQLNPNPFEGADYSWVGPGLSCTDCPTPTVSGLTPGSYNYYATLTTPFCVLADTLVITVLPGQQPQYLIADSDTICNGESIQIGGPAQPGTAYSWSSVPFGFGSILANPTVSPTTTTKYFLTASNSTCAVPALDSITITVNPVAVVNVTNDTMICQGQPVQLANTASQAGVVYSWVPNTGTMDNPTEANPIETPQVTTTYILSATLGQCVTIDTVTVTVIPINLQLNTPDTVRICQGKSLTIQANVSPAGTPVTWSPVTALQIAPDNLSAVATPYETTLYTVSASVPGCSRFSTVYVAVDSLPVNLNILPSDTTVCIGNKVLLTSPVYEPAEYQYMNFTWTPGEGQLTPDSLFNMVVQADTTTIYRRLTQNGACLDTAFAVVNVIVPPQMMITPADTSICPNNPVLLTLTADPNITDIKWTPETGLSCSDCKTPTAIVGGSTTYTVTGEYEGCSTSTSATINVVSPPQLVFPTDLNLCAGESITLNSATDPTATYTWTSTDPTFTQTNVPQPVVTPTQATTTYTVTANNGCPSSGSITVKVFDATLTVRPDTSVCRFEPVLITASGTAEGTYVWSSGQTTQAFTADISATTTYSVVYTYGDGCTKTDEVVVTVNGESVPLELPANPLLCPGESVTLNNATVPTGATYAWTASPADGTLAATAGNPTVSPAVSTQYTVTATLGLCTTTRMVNVNVATGTLNLGPDQTICKGTTITLNSNATSGTLTWSTGASSNTIVVTPDTTTTYSVTLEYGNGCILTDNVTITVIPSFNLSIVAAPNTPSLNLGQELELTANVSPTGQYTYNWVENGSTPIGTTQIINTTITTNLDSIRYQVTVTSPNGCTQEASIGFLVIQPKFEIPNAFSPNGDMSNPVFEFKITVGEPGAIKLEKMEIFNRWGQKVFTSTETITSWDGNVDGKPAPVDTYIYRISLRRADGALLETRTGEVTLIR